MLSYFDGWGSRVYIFSSEIMCPRNGASCPAEKKPEIKKLAISGEALAEFGIDYIFSAAPIGNSDEIGLVNLGTFSGPESAWIITVYKTPGKKL